MGIAQGESRYAVPTIDGLLDLRAADSAEVTFLRFSSGGLTYGEARCRSTGLAHGLRGIGVHRGDLVPVLMSNGPTFAITWLALCTLATNKSLAVLSRAGFSGEDLATVAAAAAKWSAP